MISIDVARALQQAGLTWRPATGDFFRIEQADFEHDVFTVSEMAIEPHEFDTGTILGFNGTTEWALDSLALEDALWMPREDQLRVLLGDRFRALRRFSEVDGTSRYRVEVDRDEVNAPVFEALSAEDAYGAAVLAALVSNPAAELDRS